MLVYLEACLSCRRRCRRGKRHSSMSRPVLTRILCRRRRLKASSVCMSLCKLPYPILRDTNQTHNYRWLHMTQTFEACLPFQRWRTFHSGNNHSSMNGRRINAPASASYASPSALLGRHVPPHMPEPPKSSLHHDDAHSAFLEQGR